mgnify:CR=1 FL=1
MFEKRDWIKNIPLFNVFLALIFLAAMVFVTVRYGPSLTGLMSSPDNFRELLNSYGYRSVLVFILLQILQVVVAAIPGEVVQLAGGYIYGTFAGTVYLVAGVIIGSVIVFYASRLIGYPLVKVFVKEESLKRLEFLVNSSKSEAAMFVLFLIPGLPKDILTYIAGLTPVAPLRFIIIATVGRFPALLASAYIGANLQERNYTIVIILSAAAVVLFLAGVFLRDRIIDKVQSLVNSKRQ